MTRVLNLATGKYMIYSCPAEQAVIAAHAQSVNDWNTWDYYSRYGEQVRRGKHSVGCGDCAALNEREVENEDESHT